MGESSPQKINDLNHELNQLRAQVRLLSQAKDRQREMYLRTPAMLHSCGSQGRVINVSDRWLESMGYQRHEVLGRLETEFFSQESCEEYLKEHWPRFQRQGRLDDVPLTMVRKDGRRIQVLFSSVAEEASPGEPGGWLTVLRDITRQVEAEKALEETRGRLSGIFENSSVPMGMADLQGHWLEVNPALCDLLGYSRREMKQMDNLSLSHSEDREEFARRVVELIKGETPSLRMNLRYMHKSGDPVWVDMYVNPVRGADGRTSSLVGAGVDITERKRAQEALAASESRFRELVESIREVFIVRDPYSGQLHYISPAAEEIFGNGREYMYANPLGLLDMVLPMDRPVLEKALADQRVRGADTDVEFRIQRADGSLRWIRDRAVCRRGPDGRVERVLGIAEDVTERKQAQLALAKSQEKFSMVFKSSPVWMAITTQEDGVFLDVNDAFSEETGYTRGEVLGRTPTDVGLWTDPHRLSEALRFLKEQGVVRDFEIEYSPKGGGRRYALLSAEAFELEGRRCIISVISDVSRHRLAESALRQASAILELAEQAAHLGYWSFDQEAREVHWSEAMFEIMGQDPTKGVPPYESHDQIFHPEDWAAFNELVRRSVEIGEPFDMETRIPWPDGTMHYVHSWGVCLPDRRGGPNHLFGISLDITERKRSEQQRRELLKELGRL
ncbi:MAG: PAS domain S-box protein, partial [Deltaproteobacteria bacterium]|nr:PAS domain S-box protein [Deltaproteobacteria bacterium]